MSHNLTQPEEVDLIWAIMAAHDMDVDTPIPDWAQLSETMRYAERCESMVRIDYMERSLLTFKAFQDTGSSLAERR